MDVFYTETAKRQLKKLEHDLQERIVDKVRFYAAQPDPLEFAEPLTGQDAYWPAPGSEDTELGVFMGPEVSHGKAEVYTRVQA